MPSSRLNRWLRASCINYGPAHGPLDRNALAEISSGQAPMGGKHITLSGDLRTMSDCT
jgi:hypothetical protein